MTRYKSRSCLKRNAPSPSRGLRDRVIQRAIAELRPYPDNPRQHPDRQIAALARSMQRFGVTNPVLLDENGTILAGHGRIEAAKRLRLATVPTLTIVGLSDAEQKALVIADNRVPEQALWDNELLKGHFEALIEVSFDVEFTGFSA